VSVFTMTLPYPPSANTIWRNYRGVTVTSQEAQAYKNTVGWLAREAGVVMLAGDVVFSVDIFRPRQVGDLDNRLKLLLDSLNGVAWNDDSQIVEIHARRFDDKRNPRVEVTVATK
jgi:crossover junction endodeoxyribonuclease RusA